MNLVRCEVRRGRRTSQTGAEAKGGLGQGHPFLLFETKIGIISALNYWRFGDILEFHPTEVFSLVPLLDMGAICAAANGRFCRRPPVRVRFPPSANLSIDHKERLLTMI